MSLPNLPAGDKFRREVRTEWGGINLNESASDGELVEAVNMSSREFPVLSTERFNRKTATLNQIIAPYLVDGKLGYIQKIGTNSYKLYDPTTGGGDKNISLTDAQADKVQYGMMGNRMVIWPCKQIYDFSLHTVSDLEATWSSVSGQCVFIEDGTYEGVPAEGNTLKVFDASDARKFDRGDAVTIEYDGKTITAIIQEVSVAVSLSTVVYTLTFYENTFDIRWRGTDRNTGYLHHYSSLSSSDSYTIKAGDNYWQFSVSSNLSSVDVRLIYDNSGNVSLTYTNDFTVPQTISNVTAGSPTGPNLVEFTQQLNQIDTTNAGAITVSRAVPDIDYICVNENRVWGCKGDTIYASKLGDPLNWNVYDGLSTDSWTTETGTDGNFTGCCSFQSYPTFFKEGAVFKVLGDEPKDFTLRKLNVVGVKSGCFRSIVEIRGHLYYLSNIGAVQWNGGDYPQMISAALGTHPGQLIGPAVGGTDGARYFLELTRYGATYTDGAKYASAQRTFVYDTRFGTWHELNIVNGSSRAFCTDGSNSYMISYDDPGAVIFSLSEIPTNPLIYNWAVTFADSARAFKKVLTGSESKKGVLRLLIRCRLAGTMKVWISYDGGDFEEAAEIEETSKTSKVVPLILRRCDYWQLRLTGTGDAVIYSIAVERYGGEWQQA